MLSRTSSAPNATTGKRLANCSINWMPSWTSAPALKTRSAVISFHSPKDGLKQAWRGVCWMNPPYGSALPTWMAKAYASSLEGATVVCLVPARTDTRWWHDFAMRGEIRLIQGRLRLGRPVSALHFRLPLSSLDRNGICLSQSTAEADRQHFTENTFSPL